jgi:MFS family permease
VRLTAWGILVVASLGVFLGGAELMVVAIALPSIVADFGGWADLGHASWIVNAYLLAYIVAMPLGRASRRPVGRSPAVPHLARPLLPRQPGRGPVADRRP